MSHHSTGSSSASSAGSGRGRGVALLEAIKKRMTATAACVEAELARKASELRISPLASKDAAQATVIRRGSGGREATLSANYVELSVEEGKGVFEYAASFSPDVQRAGIKFNLINQHRELFGDSRMFDGNRLLIPNRLGGDDAETELQSVVPGTDENVTITLRYVAKKSIGHPDCLALYNYLFQRVFRSMEMTPLQSGTDRAFFNAKAKATLDQHGVEIWPGYVVSVDQMEGGVYLQCDTSNKVMRTRTVYDLVKDCYGGAKQGVDYQDVAKKELIGCTVITRYNNKTYKINDIDFDASPESTFATESGVSTSFMDYYRRAYNMKIGDAKQPLLVSYRKSKKASPDEEPVKLCLIPELCFVCGMSEVQRKDFKVIRDVSEHTRHRPDKRQQLLNSLLKSIAESKEAMKHLRGWGIVIPTRGVKLDGRVLQPATLMFGGGHKETVGTKGDWGRASMTKLALKAVDLRNWSVIVPAKESNAAWQFVKTVKYHAPKMGVIVQDPRVVKIHNDRTETFLTAIKELGPDQNNLVVTIFTGPQRSDRYDAVKKLCYVELGVNSQVIMHKTLCNEKRMQTACQKLLLQMNCKLGGELWGCQVPLQGLMVIGIDVYRDKTANLHMAAVVASLNASFSRYNSEVVYEKTSDLSAHLRVAVRHAVVKNREANGGVWPERIVIYRDGVNAGNYGMMEREATGVREAIQELYDDNKAAFKSVTVAVVQKRVKTRVYHTPVQEQEGAASELPAANPPPGTVLDHTVTLRTRYDFYLVPMNVNQGTVSPTHFVVVHEYVAGAASSDGAAGDIAPGALQNLSYLLTHMYFNWPGNVKVPAPCQYAHKLVTLVGDSLHRQAKDSMSNRLYYL